MTRRTTKCRASSSRSSPIPGDTCKAHSLTEPAPEILAKFKEQQKEESGNVGDGGTDLSSLTVCVVPQLHDPATNKGYAKGDTCSTDTGIGWCYVENDHRREEDPRWPLPAGAHLLVRL